VFWHAILDIPRVYLKKGFYPFLLAAMVSLPPLLAASKPVQMQLPHWSLFGAGVGCKTLKTIF
jgi:hypothetical protein